MPGQSGRSPLHAKRHRDEGPYVPDRLKLFRDVAVPSELVNEAKLLFKQRDEAKLAQWFQSRPKEERQTIRAVLVGHVCFSCIQYVHAKKL